MYKIMKKMYINIKIRGQRYFLKHATSDQSDKTFLLPSKQLSQWLSSLALGLYVHDEIKQNIIKKKCIKSDSRRFFFKLVTNDRSDKMFLLTSKFCPLGLSAPAPGLYSFIKS